MPFAYKETEIPGLILLQMHQAEDHRGVYQKVFEKHRYASFGLLPEFTEFSDIYSHKGVLRGMHYQTEQSQAKLVHGIRGRLFDVAIDLREASPTFGHFHTELLTGGDGKAIFIPEGFAHGFLALDEDTVFSYQCTGCYVPEACGGIRWNDPELNIPWPLEGIDRVILSEKDAAQETFADYCKRIGRI